MQKYIHVVGICIFGKILNTNTHTKMYTTKLDVVKKQTHLSVYIVWHFYYTAKPVKSQINLGFCAKKYSILL